MKINVCSLHWQLIMTWVMIQFLVGHLPVFWNRSAEFRHTSQSVPFAPVRHRPAPAPPSAVPCCSNFSLWPLPRSFLGRLFHSSYCSFCAPCFIFCRVPYCCYADPCLLFLFPYCFYTAPWLLLCFSSHWWWETSLTELIKNTSSLQKPTLLIQGNFRSRQWGRRFSHRNRFFFFLQLYCPIGT